MLSQTWAQKATHCEQANGDPTKANSVILDSSMRRVPNFIGDLHRVVLLGSWDRLRYPERATIIAAGRSGFSMGAWVKDYRCGVCSASFRRRGGCRHFDHEGRPRMLEDGGKVAYRDARGVTGFELSSVKFPANRSSWAHPIG